MRLFEGNWKAVPGFVSHLDHLEKWLLAFGGIASNEEPTEDYFVSDHLRGKLNNWTGSVWTMISYQEGVCLELGEIEGDWQILGYLLTNRSYEECRTEFPEERIPLDAVIQCSNCNGVEDSDTECHLCEDSGRLFLPFEEFGLPL